MADDEEKPMTTGTSDRTTAPPQPPPAAQHAQLAPWRHAAELGPVITGGVFAAGSVLSMFRVPALPVIAVAVALAGAVSVAAFVMARSAAGAAWVTASACCAAGWSAYAALAGPWSWQTVTGLVVPAAILMPLWPAIRHHEQRAEDEERRRQAAAAAATGLRKWAEHLARVGQKGVQATGRTDTRAGYDLTLRLPAHGRVTYKSLANSAEKLEVAARVRRGSLRFEQLPGAGAHEVILHVSERDFLAETIRMPLPSRPRSINDPIPVGVREDGSIATVTLREVAALIVGLRGSGKSTLLNVLIAQLAFCVDAVIFVVDLKHRLARPWVQPWLDKQAYRPVIDWMATTPEETDLLLDACLRGIAARSSQGDGKEKIIPSIHTPAVIVIIDEMAVVFGQNMGGYRYSDQGPTNFQLATKGKRMTVLGRSEAVDAILATQRGTVTMTGDGDLKSQCQLRIGLGVATEADARLVIPDDVHIAANLAQLTHPGSGIIQVKQGRVVPVKFYRLEPEEDIPVIARMTGHWRPAPDPLLAGAFGEVYAERWTGRGGYLVTPGPVRMPALTPPGTSPDEFEEIVRRELSGIDVHLPDDDTASPPRRRMRAFVRKMTPPGVSVGAIVSLLEHENMPVTRQTIHKWLNEDAAAGLVEKSGFANWKWRGGL
jgi:hypothetical protein